MSEFSYVSPAVFVSILSAAEATSDLGICLEGIIYSETVFIYKGGNAGADVQGDELPVSAFCPFRMTEDKATTRDSTDEVLEDELLLDIGKLIPKI